MNYATSRISATSWTSTRACYSQRRLMLWSVVSAQAVDAGRRFMPPREPGAGTQPGRERPHLRRPSGRPSVRPGVAHVPAASNDSTSDSARHRLVLRTCDVHPTFTAPTVAHTTRDRARDWDRVSA